MFFNIEVDEVVEMLDSDKINGLSEEEAKKRLEENGENVLVEERKKTFLDIFLSQFQDFLILILIIAAILSFFIGEGTDGVMILFIVIINSAISAFQEYKANGELEALKKLSVSEAVVIRDGKAKKIPFKEIVVGDIIQLETGESILADGRIIQSIDLKVDESSLTGESLAVDKNEQTIKGKNIPLADRKNMVYSSCIVTYGKCRYIVTNTGMDTQIGKIAGMLTNQEEVLTPLNKKTKEIGKVLCIGCIIICLLIFIIGFYHGNNALDMFMTSISLAVAAIPEGLPGVITIVLSIGISRLSKKGAIIRKMHAVETLGNANVICSDKTGTLTMNEMSVEKVYVPDFIIEKENFINNKNIAFNMLINIAYDCNDSQISKNRNKKEVKIGEPTEIALLKFAKTCGICRDKIERQFSLPFDSERKMMSCVLMQEGKYIVYTKGASDIILKKCSYYVYDGKIKKMLEDDRKFFLKQVDKLSGDAYRVLGFCYKVSDYISDRKEVEQDLVFVGLIAMMDPPREEVYDAIKVCKNAGIKPVMITGDHKLTAQAIARKLGILKKDEECISSIELENLTKRELYKRIDNISVYARVTPKDKVRIIKAFQDNGNVVIMTGDGVNDAAALKKADIGCAMGITGSDVAKSASDMVLSDDNFTTIVRAIKEGRGVYQNIKKAIHFLISCNIGEIMTLLLATILNYPMPLLPIHLLWVNLVTDSLPALAFGVDKVEDNLMNKEILNEEKNIFTLGFSVRVLFEGFLIGFVTLVGFWFGNTYYDLKTGRTFAFLILCLSQLFHTFNVRAMRESIFDNPPTRNKILIASDVISMFLAVSIVIIPILRNVFDLALLDINKWDFVLTLSLVPLVSCEILKLAKDIFIEENSLINNMNHKKETI